MIKNILGMKARWNFLAGWHLWIPRRGHRGSVFPFFPDVTLHISSIWLFLSCNPYNKSTTLSIARFQQLFLVILINY